VASSDQIAVSAPSARRRRGPGLRARIRLGFHQWWFAYAMLLPVAVVMGLLVFYPLVRGILFGFTDANAFNIGNRYIPSSYHYIGIRNFREILGSSQFRSVLGFTAVWTFVNVFFHFTIGLALALALNRTRRFRGISTSCSRRSAGTTRPPSSATRPGPSSR
jgi:ABC-type sugar transport system permease subunit